MHPMFVASSNDLNFDPSRVKLIVVNNPQFNNGMNCFLKSETASSHHASVDFTVAHCSCSAAVMSGQKVFFCTMWEWARRVGEHGEQRMLLSVPHQCYYASSTQRCFGSLYHCQHIWLGWLLLQKNGNVKRVQQRPFPCRHHRPDWGDILLSIVNLTSHISPGSQSGNSWTSFMQAHWFRTFTVGWAGFT